MKTEKTTEKRGAGRPPSEFETRLAIRIHDDQEEVWRAAAATCGLSLPEWARVALDAEAARATHVPILKRAKSAR